MLLFLTALFPFSLLEEAISKEAFPGCSIALIQEGEITAIQSFGTLSYGEEKVTNTTRYDLASLTKPLATSLAFMKLSEEIPKLLTHKAANYLPQLKTNATIADLLSHTSGFPSDTPLHLKEEIFSLLFSLPPTSLPAPFLYSDLGYILLGLILEKITKESIDTYVTNHFYTPLHLFHTSFDPHFAAPTENGLTGRVHDEKAAAIGSSCASAGLFSNIEDVATLVQFLLSDEPSLLKKSTIELFLPLIFRQNTHPEILFHFGFTGCSIHIHYHSKSALILLSNRVYPSRDNRQIDWIRSALLTHFLSLISQKQKN